MFKGTKPLQECWPVPFLFKLGGMVMSAKQNKETDRHYVEEFWNKKRDLAKLSDFLTPDYVYHGVGGEITKGIEDMKQFALRVRQGLPDIHFTFEDIIAEGDIVMYRYMTRGTTASSKKFSIMGFIQDRFRDGKITETWEILNMDELYPQIGRPPA